MKIYLVGSDRNAFIVSKKKKLGILLSFAELRPGGRSLKVWEIIKKRYQHENISLRKGQ